jgi:Lon protease-like protein
MTADALAGARLIAIALLKPGFERKYYTLRAPVHGVVGLGQIVASEQLDDGNYNILLRGLTRAQIVAEVAHKPYRLAQLAPLSPPAPPPPERAAALRRDLRGVVENQFACCPELRAHWLNLFDTPLELGDLADLIAAGLKVEGELRQRLLAEADPLARASCLAEYLRTLAAVMRARSGERAGSQWKMN